MEAESIQANDPSGCTYSDQCNNRSSKVHYRLTDKTFQYTMLDEFSHMRSLYGYE